MNELIAVDPGLRHCGVALFLGGELKAAGLVENPNTGRGPSAWRDMAFAVDGWAGSVWAGIHSDWKERFTLSDYPTVDRSSLALEVMQVYGGPRKEDPNDLLELNGVQGAISATVDDLDEIVAYLPRQWKGQVPKDVMCRRITKPGRLTEQELENTGLVRADNAIGAKHPNIPTHLLHNVLDAIGIGLYHLNRLG